MSDKFILDGKNPVPCNDLLEWAKWMETTDRHVANDVIGDVRVSTVFLGLNHRFGLGKKPILFETMIFGGEYDEFQARCSTWEEAEKQHAEAVALAKVGYKRTERLLWTLMILCVGAPGVFVLWWLSQ